MAEIEAFLRTGEAPPPAPEPRPVTSLPPEGVTPPADPFLDGPPLRAVPGGRLHRGPWWRRLSRVNPIRHGLPLGRSGGIVLMAREWRMRRRIRRGRGLPAEPPKWTAARALAVVGVLGVLLLLPSILPGRSSGSGGSDHASAAPAGPGYSFLRLNRGGTPMRWNPCSPIYYVTDFSAAPSYAAADLQTAVEQVSRATGILFVDKGSTTTFPSGGGNIGADGQAGPVVIAWGSAAQTTQVNFASGATGADALARTEPIAAVDQNTGHGVFVTGTVLIGSGAGRLPQGFGPGGLGVLMLHELGHLMGLANVSTPGQVMSTHVLASATTGLGSADRAGLQRLGTASGCLKVPSQAAYEPAL